ncbi:MAG: EFR1 family ferrodoxin [Muribaculaceae bacterium]|nr:EFR1 family ferrodoxin [Muribaculaceae bacterium]
MEIRIFSGMGNSLAVGRELEKRLASDVSDDLLWVFPIYAWGVPPVVVRHLMTLDLSSRLCHMVCTYGDEAGAVEEQWRKIILARGGRVGGIYGVQMPNTYVCLPGFDVDSSDVRDRKLADCGGRVAEIADLLLAGNHEPYIFRGSFARFKTRVIYPGFVRWAMNPSKFSHTSGCVGCGMCIRHCPNHNITADSDGAPLWGSDCAFCLRCYHICPHHAVAYGRQTAHKGQYLNPQFFKNL